jgi:hypothetical protein
MHHAADHGSWLIQAKSPPATVRTFGRMTPTQTVLDPETAQRLGVAFNECFDQLAAPDDLFSDDAFFDMLPPLWRFQIEGAPAFVAQLRAIAEGPVSARVIRIVPTYSGFVLEHEETMETPHGTEIARRLWLCEVRDGRIADVTGYCNGGWDDDLRARHAQEAPMLRP